MAKYRTVHTSFWDDAKVVDDFTSDDKYLFLYLLTNQKTNQIGCYELPISQIMRDTGLSKQKIEKNLQKLEKNLKVIIYDYETKEIFIKNWNKYNWINSSLIKKCIEKEFETIKSSNLKSLIYPLYMIYIKNNTPCKSHITIENTPYKKEKEKKKENKIKIKENKNKKSEEKEKASCEADSNFPTLTQILSYALELGFKDEEYCEKFYNHYSGIGWVNGTGQIITDWQSVFKNWLKKDKKNVPNWCDKEIEAEQASEEEIEALNERINKRGAK